MAILVERDGTFAACPGMAAEVKVYQQLWWREISEGKDIPQDVKEEIRLELDDIDTNLEYEGGRTYQAVTDSESIDDYFAALSKSTSAAFQQVYGDCNFYFVMDKKGAWLGQKNSHKKVVAATDYLKSIGIKRSYIGGIRVDSSELVQMLFTTFWLGRCNAALPDIYFTAEGAYTAFNICKDGGLHVGFYNNAEATRLESAFVTAGLKEVEGRCGDGGAIEGRRTIV